MTASRVCSGTAIMEAPNFMAASAEPKPRGVSGGQQSAPAGSLGSTLQSLTEHVAQENDKQVVLETSGLHLVPPKYLAVVKNVAIQLIRNTGPEKETAAATEAAAVYERILDPNSALLVYAAPAPSMDMPSGGYHFVWRRLLGAQADDPRAAVERGRDDRGKTDWFHVRTAWDPKVVAHELGVFFRNIVSG